MRLPALWRCIQCGVCCRHMVGQKFGLALTPTEKKRLEILASRRGVSIDLRPLTWSGYKVTLYQFARAKCPFLDRHNRCMIYRWRPLACRMYPLHPHGVSDCTHLDHLQRRGFRVDFPPHLEKAALRYMQMVIPLIRSAVKRYNLNRGWEINRPFQFAGTYGKVG